MLIGVCTSVVSVVYAFKNQVIPALEYGVAGLPDAEFSPARIFFVGDIMLGRRVETMSEEFGLLYPFESTAYILAGSDITVGNLEGPVPELHVHTPDLGYIFSFDERVLPLLKSVGFDVLSLANNHTRDHGTSGFAHTYAACTRAALTCAGDPENLGTSSISYQTVKGVTVGFIMIHATVLPIDMDALMPLLTRMRTESDVQIAYVHWGDEYALVHNEAQESLAYTIVDNGIDAVIGHHPHVVQDVALYQGKPIFYSLGNFVFDQYFSSPVQEGLGVHMEIDDEAILYRLLAFESTTTRSQPREHTTTDAETLFARILAPIAIHPEVNTVSGVIRTLR